MVARLGVFMATGTPLPPGPSDPGDFPALNAWRAASTRRGQALGLLYCEGYASVRGIPVPRRHAWCLSPEGGVLDPSWLNVGEHYLGVAIDGRFASNYLPNAWQGLLGLYEQSPLLLRPQGEWLLQPPAPVHLRKVAS